MRERLAVLIAECQALGEHPRQTDTLHCSLVQLALTKALVEMDS